MSASLEDLKQHIGRSETSEDVVTISQVGRLAAALDVDHPAPRHGDPIPPGWHGAFCPTLVKLSMLRADGQPAGGGVTPPVPLPRQILTGVDVRFDDPIRIGDRLTKVNEVADVVVDSHKANPSVQLTIRETISSSRGIAVIEERKSSYFEKSGPAARKELPEVPDRAAWRKTYESDAAMIFRLSAVRYNSHRIHYDREYATRVEGLPGLVVPLSLVSVLMMEQCRAITPERKIETFCYRSIKRIFDSGPFTIHGGLDGDKASMWATDFQGKLAVTSELSFAP